MEDKVIEIPTELIDVDSDRYRKDFGNIDSLVESIKATKHNIVPIIVTPLENGRFRLVAGERRTKACIQAGVNVRAIVCNLDQIDHRIYEITENLERKDFDWKEKILATEDLADMLSSKYGKVTIRRIAEKTGLSIGAVHTDLDLAKAIKEAPDVFEGCKDRASALKALQRYKIDEASVELALRKKKTNYGQKAANIVFKGNCLDLIESIPDGYVNAVISDPFYGININSVSAAGSTKENRWGHNYDDSTKLYYDTMVKMIPKLYKVLAKDSWICLFCASAKFEWLLEELEKAGFNCDPKPVIWDRMSSGVAMHPTKMFASCYEPCVYGYKGDAVLTRQGQPNVLSYKGVVYQEKDHPVQKPLELMEELISRFCLPGHVVLDFMSGSGTTLVAAIKRGCIPIGFELDDRYYNQAIRRISDALAAKDAGEFGRIE